MVSSTNPFGRDRLLPPQGKQNVAPRRKQVEHVGLQVETLQAQVVIKAMCAT